MGNWNFANILTNQVCRTLLLLAILPHISQFHLTFSTLEQLQSSIDHKNDVFESVSNIQMMYSTEEITFLVSEAFERNS